MPKLLKLRRSKDLVVRDFMLYLAHTSKESPDYLTTSQQAFIMAKMGFRPTLTQNHLRLTNTIIIPTRTNRALNNSAFVANQILSIIRSRQGINKYDLHKECEKVLVSSQNLKRAIDNSIYKLKKVGLIKVVRGKSKIRFS